MQRVIYPLNVRYPAACCHVGRSANDNILLADALEYAEVSCRGGDRERLCTRVTVKIPWTPVLYLAVREDGAYRLRRELKLLLLSRRMGSVNARAWISVCGLTRAVDEFAWRRNERMRLYEFAFDNFAALGTAKSYLRDNALARSGEYLLFAVDDNVAFNVALTASLRESTRRKRPRKDDKDESSSSSNGVGSCDATFLDLSAAFELASWCRVDLTRADRLKRLSAAEIRANGLPEDPLATLPVVSYDIETIAANENTLPRGTEEDQKLASLALTVHEPNRGAEYAAYAFVYAPVASAERLERLETRARETFAPERTDVMFFTDERLLLWSTLETLRNNEFLVPYYSLDNVADARSFACILVGYNAWEYDHPFFVARLAYHGLHEDALALGEFLAPSDGPREPRFCRSQVSFDLMKHVISRYRAQVGSVALAHVSRYFGTEDNQRKLDFDSVAIRRLYYDTNTGREHFDEAAAFDDGATLSLHNAVRYNVRDCAAVYHLARNVDFLSTTAQYARHFYVSVTEASYVGNSRLLPNAFAARSLSTSRTVLHWRDNATSHTTVRLLRSAATHPSSPRAYGTNELFDAEKRDGAIFDEARLMRVGDKSYLGGINSAESGRYAHVTAVDFASFYPSIGCAYRLSMETVRVITVAGLLEVFTDRAVLDEAMECGMLRAFDYEPEVSPHRRTRCARTGDPVLHGRDELARGTLSASADAWYEGVEFVDSEEMLRSSVDPTRRRVLTVYAPNDTPPVIAGLWRYYLDRRRDYKTKMRETCEPAARRVLGCQEKMFKVVANSLYGYLNYRRSAVYAPAVAAAVTLLSRKTFHETTWVCVRMFPRYLAQKREGDATTMTQQLPSVDLRVVYRDTDGIVVRADRALGGDEAELPRLVNEQFRAQGRADIALELEDANTHDCTIMGKKKYWKTLADGSFVTKGFERNAQPFVKALVRALQRNANEMALVSGFSRRFHSYRLAVRDVENFFLCMYDGLHDYYRRHGPRDFEFNIALNPRENSGPEAIFIQSLLDRYDYDTGDRARCVFALDSRDCTATLFRLSRDFDPKSESINYYKIVRRLAIYLLQVIEGFKRNDTTIESRLRIGPQQFDETLRRAYVVWLADTERMTRRLYSGFFRIDDDDDNDSPRHDFVADEDLELLPLTD